MNNEIKKQFIAFLKKINQEEIKNFSGLGFVLYNSNLFPKKYYADLRASAKFPKGINISDSILINFFIAISDYRHPLHEGYHFFNEKGQLTHISQCFLPPIIKNVKPNESHGVRHLTAQYGSYLKGVIAIGVLNSNHKAYHFSNGKYFNL